MPAPEAVIVMATYNEADSIAQLLQELSEFKVIVVDDSSPDGTGAIAEGYEHVQVLTRAKKLGIASAYLEGFRAAIELRPNYIIQMDAGLTHEPLDAARLLEQAKATDGDLVIGSRFLERHFAGYRTAISYGAAFLMRRLGIQVRDATSGFRCWRTSLLASVDFSQVRARGFAFQLELLYLARRAGGRTSEMTIDYRLTTSSFNFKMVAEALQVYARLWRHRLTNRAKTVKRDSSIDGR